MSLNDLDNNSIALDGIDPVSYYNGEGLKGQSNLSFELRGISYRFANKENLELFQKDPAKYIPDFAGSYLRHTKANEGAEMDTQHQNNNADPAYLESRGMLDDTIDPLKKNIDPALKNNLGYETDHEVEMSNLSDSDS